MISAYAVFNYLVVALLGGAKAGLFRSPHYLFWFVFFFPVIVLFCFARNTGEDYETYVSIISQKNYFYYLYRWELFSFILMFLADVFGEPQLFFAANRLIFYWGLIFLFSKMRDSDFEDGPLYFLLFIFSSGWLFSGQGNLVRQYTASIFLLIALYYFRPRNTMLFKSLIFVLVAFFFHSISVFVYLASVILLRLSWRSIFIVFLIVFLFFGIYSEFFFGLVFGTPFYFLQAYSEIKIQSSLRTLVSEFTFLPLILLYFLKKEKGNNLSFFFRVSMLDMIFSIVPVFIGIANVDRLAHSFKVADPYLFVLLVRHVRDRVYILVYLAVLAALSLLRFILGVSGYSFSVF